MVEIMRMPGVLAGADTGILYSWMISVGDDLTVGQEIAEIETEKATVEITAEISGKVGRLLVSEGDEVDVGAPILAILTEGETETDIDVALGALTPPDEEATTEPDPEPRAQQIETPPSARGEVGGWSMPQTETRLFTSPIARRLAREHALDPTELEGTGPGGRIVRRDVERALAARVETGEAPTQVAEPMAQATVPEVLGEEIPLTPMRRAIARRLTESKSTIPHFYLTADCQVDDLLELRQQINSSGDVRVSVNDLILKAVAVAFREVPEANSVWVGEAIRRYRSVDVSVAVAIEEGLLTPVVRDVEELSITTLSTRVADLVARARSGDLKQSELEGGSFTVSNLGMYGTKEFSAILNPPQSGILAVGAARQAPIVTAAGELTVGRIMTVTLSADHRVLDGAIAATWLAAFQNAVENPMTILL